MKTKALQEVVSAEQRILDSVENIIASKVPHVVMVNNLVGYIHHKRADINSRKDELLLRKLRKQRSV